MIPIILFVIGIVNSRVFIRRTFNYPQLPGDRYARRRLIPGDAATYPLFGISTPRILPFCDVFCNEREEARRGKQGKNGATPPRTASVITDRHDLEAGPSDMAGRNRLASRQFILVGVVKCCAVDLDYRGLRIG